VVPRAPAKTPEQRPGNSIQPPPDGDNGLQRDILTAFPLRTGSTHLFPPTASAGSDTGAGTGGTITNKMEALV